MTPRITVFTSMYNRAYTLYLYMKVLKTRHVKILYV